MGIATCQCMASKQSMILHRAAEPMARASCGQNTKALAEFKVLIEARCQRWTIPCNICTGPVPCWS
eukprot:12924090-Prorocentrum_lima.AAC.1